MSRVFDPTPVSLTSFIVDLLKTCFEESTEYPFIRGDTTRSKISILEANRLNPESIQKRPGVVVKRGSVNVMRRVIGDSMSKSKEGELSFFVDFNGSFNIQCVSTAAEESEIIAEEVNTCLLCFQTLIAKDWDFLTFQTVSIGETVAFEEYKEAFNTPVVIQYSIAKIWTLKQNSPVLRKLNTLIKGVVC